MFCFFQNFDLELISWAQKLGDFFSEFFDNIFIDPAAVEIRHVHSRPYPYVQKIKIKKRSI